MDMRVKFASSPDFYVSERNIPALLPNMPVSFEAWDSIPEMGTTVTITGVIASLYLKGEERSFSLTDGTVIRIW